jgi:hypothetical protein
MGTRGSHAIGGKGLSPDGHDAGVPPPIADPSAVPVRHAGPCGCLTARLPGASRPTTT